MKTSVCVAFVLVLGELSHPRATSCPDDWNIHKEKCYLLLTEEAPSLNQARKKCKEDFTAKLFLPTSNRENDIAKSIGLQDSENAWLDMRYDEDTQSWLSRDSNQTIPFEPPGGAGQGDGGFNCSVVNDKADWVHTPCSGISTYKILCELYRPVSNTTTTSTAPKENTTTTIESNQCPRKKDVYKNTSMPIVNALVSAMGVVLLTVAVLVCWDHTLHTDVTARAGCVLTLDELDELSNLSFLDRLDECLKSREDTRLHSPGGSDSESISSLKSRMTYTLSPGMTYTLSPAVPAEKHSDKQKMRSEEQSEKPSDKHSLKRSSNATMSQRDRQGTKLSEKSSMNLSKSSWGKLKEQTNMKQNEKHIKTRSDKLSDTKQKGNEESNSPTTKSDTSSGSSGVFVDNTFKLRKAGQSKVKQTDRNDDTKSTEALKSSASKMEKHDKSGKKGITWSPFTKKSPPNRYSSGFFNDFYNNIFRPDEVKQPKEKTKLGNEGTKDREAPRKNEKWKMLTRKKILKK